MQSNVQKMRMKLERIVEIAESFGDKAVTLGLIIDRAKEALALPLRQCDIGTAEEQYKRFQDFCLHNSFMGVCSEHCPLYTPCIIGSYQNTGRARCIPAWAQMPYESEVKDAT